MPACMQHGHIAIKKTLSVGIFKVNIKVLYRQQAPDPGRNYSDNFKFPGLTARIPRRICELQAQDLKLYKVISRVRGSMYRDRLTSLCHVPKKKKPLTYKC